MTLVAAAGSALAVPLPVRAQAADPLAAAAPGPVPAVQAAPGGLLPAQAARGSLHPAQAARGSLHPAQAARGSLHPAQAARGSLVPPLDEQGRLSARWHLAGLPQQQPPLTRYSATRVDGRAALQIDADASYGNWVLDAAGQPVPRHISWSWRIEQPNPAADLRHKAGDDTAARVCLSFDLALDRVPFVERQKMRMARSVTGEHLPAATLCWVWGVNEPRETLIDNPYSRRVRYLVLRNQADGSGRWQDERRDVAADFRRAFGDESADLPPLWAVIVAADADNTGGHSRALIGGLSFEP